MTKEGRRTHLDWLRVGATLLVIGFHCARPFDTEWWHVKDPQQSEWITEAARTLSLWIMPLFFVLSGMATRFALVRKRARTVLRERVSRLAVPFAFGVLVIVPPQVYVERLLGNSLEGARAPFEGSYFDFYPHYFDGLYAFGGNFSWIGHHLWYLLVLFVITLLVVPALGQCHSLSRLDRLTHLRGLVVVTGALFLFAVELLVADTALEERALGGWSVVAYPAFFLFGLVIGSPPWEKAIRRDAGIAAVLAVAALGAQALVVWGEGFSAFCGRTLIRDVASWAGIVALIGGSERYIGSRASGLDRISSLVMPVYMIHQTVVVVLAYWLLGFEMATAFKYVVLLGLTLAIVIPLSMLVATNRWTAPLFGNAPRRLAQPAETSRGSP